MRSRLCVILLAVLVLLQQAPVANGASHDLPQFFTQLEALQKLYEKRFKGLKKQKKEITELVAWTNEAEELYEEEEELPDPPSFNWWTDELAEKLEETREEVEKHEIPPELGKNEGARVSFDDLRAPPREKREALHALVDEAVARDERLTKLATLIKDYKTAHADQKTAKAALATLQKELTELAEVVPSHELSNLFAFDALDLMNHVSPEAGKLLRELKKKRDALTKAQLERKQALRNLAGNLETLLEAEKEALEDLLENSSDETAELKELLEQNQEDAKLLDNLKNA